MHEATAVISSDQKRKVIMLTPEHREEKEFCCVSGWLVNYSKMTIFPDQWLSSHVK